jgi:hypothetical protein
LGGRARRRSQSCTARCGSPLFPSSFVSTARPRLPRPRSACGGGGEARGTGAHDGPGVEGLVRGRCRSTGLRAGDGRAQVNG